MSSSVGLSIPHAKSSLLTCTCVCFDVDSTVITEEGIDVLASHLGKGSEVSEWTSKAMGGNVKFEDALSARLGLIEPSKSSIIECLKIHPFKLSPGVEKFIETLHEKNVDVWLVSGGFRIMIEPIAEVLNIPKDNILANNILHDEEGNYVGFDSNEPTSRDLGKPAALNMIKRSKGHESIVMVGDGATDAQAKPPAVAFIGYGGVQDRESVREKADWFVYDFEELTEVVKGRE
ncbi:hypothetical protein TrVE_jg5570 [Triparma verrucosa]|uniref:phosphoserine phosphatase n=1 Tax=Triparma verrucosa TaxID=1606542 RepID=A0A9W7B8S3_9STRA|nr:hypothetical protein TrVE_jg5570 [Triparma verrucosa]